MCVTASWKETLSGTTATSPVSTEEPPTAPATSNCGSTPKPLPYLWSFTTCGGMTRICSRVEGRMSCIPNNTEKYISFSLGQLRFIDSAQFLQALLDKLVSANKPEAFQITAHYEPDQHKRGLLLRKGVHPYEYVDFWERFEDTTLPPKNAFYSKLSDEHISDDDYEHAQRVWKTFGCKSLGNYADLYCRTDVLLLADVFETFRKTCLGLYGLDSAHYYTSPGLSWDALFKKTGVELELLTDYDQHLFIEKGMRGGISMVSKLHAKANNHAVEGYDPEKPSSHIL
ncbi:hypothetical protein RRG08_010876 [Elysia crispata]|uniref:DNA-directed DNA polymerase n=1 Tax=Elysia crispata TaxID=231223 RepID=A0AAE1CLM6_9GAST|nr:hypothetical protein RRG08_010876 [Elysia crispata]